MKVTINPKSIVVWFTVTVVLLTVANVAVQIIRFAFGYEHILGLYRVFDLNSEGNLPTFYSASALLVAAALLAIISKRKIAEKATDRFYWAILSGVFFFLAADEASQLHEMFVFLLQPKVDADGIFFFAWVIPYGVLTLLLGLAYLRFVLSLPGKTKWMFIISGTVFLTGAVGFELASSAVVSSLGGWQGGFDHLYHVILYSIEEPLEMIGIVIFIYACMDYLAVSQSMSGTSVVFSYD